MFFFYFREWKFKYFRSQTSWILGSTYLFLFTAGSFFYKRGEGHFSSCLKWRKMTPVFFFLLKNPIILQLKGHYSTSKMTPGHYSMEVIILHYTGYLVTNIVIYKDIVPVSKPRIFPVSSRAIARKTIHIVTCLLFQRSSFKKRYHRHRVRNS